MLLHSALSAAATATPAGGKVGVSRTALQVVDNALESSIESSIRNLKVDDYETKKDGFDIKLYDMRVDDFDCGSPCIEPEFDDGGAIQVKLENVKLKFHMRAEAKDGIFKVATVCDAKIGTTLHVGGVLAVGLLAWFWSSKAVGTGSQHILNLNFWGTRRLS